jgi:hypothetical protein
MCHAAPDRNKWTRIMIRIRSHLTRVTFANLNAEFDNKYSAKRIHFAFSLLSTRYLVQKRLFLGCGFILCAKNSLKKRVLPSLIIKPLLLV